MTSCSYLFLKFLHFMAKHFRHQDTKIGCAVQACPGATVFEYLWSAMKPIRSLDQWDSYMIQVWARGSTFRVRKIYSQLLPKGFCLHRFYNAFSPNG
jgi:hypothetical protein